MGRVVHHCWIGPCLLAVRSIRETEYSIANVELHCGIVFTYRAKVEAQTVRMVLGRYDHHCGPPCLVDLVYPMDYKVGSSLGYCRHRLRGFLRVTLGAFSRRKNDGRLEDC